MKIYKKITLFTLGVIAFLPLHSLAVNMNVRLPENYTNKVQQLRALNAVSKDEKRAKELCVQGGDAAKCDDLYKKYTLIMFHEDPSKFTMGFNKVPIEDKDTLLRETQVDCLNAALKCQENILGYIKEVKKYINAREIQSSSKKYVTPKARTKKAEAPADSEYGFGSLVNKTDVNYDGLRERLESYLTRVIPAKQFFNEVKRNPELKESYCRNNPESCARLIRRYVLNLYDSAPERFEEFEGGIITDKSKLMRVLGPVDVAISDCREDPKDCADTGSQLAFLMKYDNKSFETLRISEKKVGKTSAKATSRVGKRKKTKATARTETGLKSRGVTRAHKASTRSRALTRSKAVSGNSDLSREVASIKQRAKNAQQVIDGKGLIKGWRKLRTYVARILNRAESAKRKAKPGSVVYKELTSAAARAQNIIDELDSIKQQKRIRRSKIKEIEARIRKYLDRMFSRADEANDK